MNHPPPQSLWTQPDFVFGFKLYFVFVSKKKEKEIPQNWPPPEIKEPAINSSFVRKIKHL